LLFTLRVVGKHLTICEVGCEIGVHCVPFG
jgi:hypothetical protein